MERKLTDAQIVEALEKIFIAQMLGSITQLEAVKMAQGRSTDEELERAFERGKESNQAALKVLNELKQQIGIADD